MNNPNSQNQQHGDNQRGVGRNRNQLWSSEDGGGRPSWREDEQNRFQNRSAWGEQNEYPQARYSPNFDNFNESSAQDRPAGQSRDYDEYGYGSGGQGQRVVRTWPTSEYENYGTQQDYSNESPGSAQSRSPYGGDNSRWSQGRDYSDSGNFGFRSGYRQHYNSDYARGGYERGDHGNGSSPWGQPGQWNPRQLRGSQAVQSSGQSTGAYGLQTQNHRGKGPKGYVRADERIREEICEFLSEDPHIDASDVSVEVRGGVVMLEGSVQDRGQKHRIEDIADSCSGVKDVHNSLRVNSSGGSGLSSSSNQSNQSETSTSSQRNTDVSAKQTKQ